MGVVGGNVAELCGFFAEAVKKAGRGCETVAFFEATAFSRVSRKRGMMGETVWLLVAGDFVRPSRMPRADEVVIAVDGGMRHAAALSVVPQWWLGDLTATPWMRYVAPFFPRGKGQTDFELALAFVRARWPQAFVGAGRGWR